MQIWDNVLIFLLFSFHGIIIQFVLLYPLVGEKLCVSDLNKNQSQRTLYEVDIEKNSCTQEKEQELSSALLITFTPLPKLSTLYLQQAGHDSIACLLLLSNLKLWVRCTTSLCDSWLSGTLWLISPDGKNDNGTYKGAMNLLSTKTRGTVKQ